MVAVVDIVERNSTGATTAKDGTTVRFKNADNATVDANDPMVIPTAGQDFSYEKNLQLDVTTAPGTNISNLKFYTDGTSGFGAAVKLWARATDGFVTPTQAQGSSEFTNDAFAYDSGTALSLGTGTFTGTGLKGSLVVLALEVETGATQGTLTAETLTFSYDEI